MLEYGINKFNLKMINRAQIMRVIWEFGPISRSDIADRLYMTRAAITVITNKMIEEGLIIEVGKVASSEKCEIGKGRRKVPLDINYNNCLQIGVYIDKHNISIGLATIKGDVLEKDNIEIFQEISLLEIAEIIEKAIRQILLNSCLKEEHISGIGIGIMPDMSEYIFKAFECEKSYYYYLQKVINERTGIPVFAENALSQLAIFCWSKYKYDGRHCKSGFLYSDDENIYLSTVLNMPSLFESVNNVIDVNPLCVNPYGCEVEGSQKGSVRYELTHKAIGRRVRGICSESKTPALYKITGGKMLEITISQIMTAVSLGDDLLIPLKDELLCELCLLINNIICIAGVKNIYFYKFGFNEQQLYEFQHHYKKIFGSKIGAKLDICDINDSHRFMCGSFYAVLKGLFSVSNKEIISEIS